MRLNLKVGNDKGFTFVDVDLWDELAIKNQNITEGQEVMTIAKYEKRSYERDGKRIHVHYFKASFLFNITG
jgi:DNA-binding cell septation regulator SpoVG